MQVREFFSIGIFLCLPFFGKAQSTQSGTLTGTVHASGGDALPGLTVRLEAPSRVTTTDAQGAFRFPTLSPGSYTLVASGLGFEPQQKIVQLLTGNTERVTFVLRQQPRDINEVVVSGQADTKSVRQQAFSVDAIDAIAIQNRNVDMNRLLDQTMGVQVRETGGMGSDFTYSIHGLTGRAVKFFLDGIPMESFGSSYRINNLPINLIDRIEVYKGVTPVHLGSDALGGAINIISRQDISRYLDATYSFGSFNTHRMALSGRWRSDKTGFTTSANVFYNSSANNYQVWGPTIEIAGEDGRPLAGIYKLRRFNDDYRSLNVRAEAGFTNVRWADQLLLSLTASDLAKGIQTGRTMAFVYGKVRYNETFLMPGVTFAKTDFFAKGLNVNAYASFNRLEGATVDTSSSKYNWQGRVIATNVNGELGGIRAQKSRYTYHDRTALLTLNATYQLASQHTLRINFTGNNTRRTGTDALAVAEWTIPFREPQHLNKRVIGLAYEVAHPNEKWTATAFGKQFGYSARTNQFDFNGSAQKVLIANYQDASVWGYGLATRWIPNRTILLKFSAENTARLPEAAELLGDGNTILSAVNLQPERSLNLNTSVQKRIENTNQQLTISTGLFYRFTRNLIWLGEADLFGTARYENLNRIQSTGLEIEGRYAYKKWLTFTANATYQDIRNKLRYTSSGAKNGVFNDRLRNTPFLPANAELGFIRNDFGKKGARLSAYISTHYVPEYFLGWPSLGARNTKKVIPTQFVQDAGVSYTTANRRYTVGVDGRNLLDRQVYDNYLLQKPGRFLSVKVRYFISKSVH